MSNSNTNNDTYKTLLETSNGFYKDKGSKFYAYAFVVNSNNEIQERRNEIRKKHHDARHHVYAYRIGVEKNTFYASDDGEPANSSGPPILGQIRSADLTNVLIIVVRYFGGTKLGIPGLINAYKTAALDAINNSKIVKKIIGKKISLNFNYPLMNNVMRILKNDDIKILNQKFTENCNIEIEIRKSKYEQIVSNLKLFKDLVIEK